MNPPIEKPNNRNEIMLVSPKYSGEKNKKGTPNLLPKYPLIIANKKNQYNNKVILYLTWENIK